MLLAVYTDAGAQQTASGATFVHVGLEEDQPYPPTWSVLQDHTGLMWFGTDLGLTRCDGYETVNFRHDGSDPSSLGGTVVRKLY